MSPKRVLTIAAIALVLYAGFAYWVLTNFEIPPLRGAALGMVLVAAVCQIGAKWFFGLLFKESIQEIGSDVRAWSAFKAALVGAGVARLIPAGGAITPVAMSWTVRDEVEESTAGPGIRTVLLNYAGLLIMAGGAVLIERPKGTIPVFSVSIIVLAPIVLVIGALLMFGSGRLGSISKYLPQFIREKVETSMVNHLPGWESQIYIWTRLALEAGALWLVMLAFNIDLNVWEALAVYAVSQLVGGLPGTPGGLGVTEFGMGLVLAAYGFPASTTVAPILIYRIVSYWLPAGLSFLAGGTTFLRSDEAKAAADAE
ncbi:MAG TPA: flippase-like domain-containing protein [Acidimicrobiia bacterium]|nr:flippase-like domain-containing protein [Acidimicrobiia bacterium]